jgi:hypothetical protein
MKRLGKGALIGSERIMAISIISCGKNSLDLRLTWVTTSPRERIEFVSQGSTVFPIHVSDVAHNRVQIVSFCDGIINVDRSSRIYTLKLYSLTWIFIYMAHVSSWFHEPSLTPVPGLVPGHTRIEECTGWPKSLCAPDDYNTGSYK